MIPEFELEALRCFNRPELEGLQIHSRYLRNLVDRHAGTLPLRSIYEVDVQYGQVDIRLTEADRDVNEMAVWGDQAPEELLRRRASLFSTIYGQMLTTHIEATNEAIDYDLVVFMGARIKPRIYETSMDDNDQEEYAMLLAHNALRGTVKHVEYQLHSFLPPPDCIIPELFGVDVAETCAMTTDAYPHPWIEKFIEMYENAECGTDVVRSVTLLHDRTDEKYPLPYSDDPLGRPQRADVPTPHSAFVKEWSRKRQLLGDIVTESAVADLFEFGKLELFVWTIKHVGKDGCWQALHYAFLLQILNA
ncbi:hypothetical protein AAVH_11156 [Aphelenchoides avenae]|nr:hypothetical protein AAVH_11156 [Aphelenchus avenae]